MHCLAMMRSPLKCRHFCIIRAVYINNSLLLVIFASIGREDEIKQHGYVFIDNAININNSCHLQKKSLAETVCHIVAYCLFIAI